MAVIRPFTRDEHRQLAQIEAQTDERAMRRGMAWLLGFAVALIGAGYGLIWLAERLRDAIHGG